MELFNGNLHIVDIGKIEKKMEDKSRLTLRGKHNSLSMF